jgi:hypothetical protein
MRTLYKLTVAGPLILVLGTGVYESRQRAFFAERISAAEEKEKEFVTRITGLENESRVIHGQLDQIAVPSGELLKTVAEVYKLRGQVAESRNNTVPAATSIDTRLQELFVREKALRDLPRRFPNFAIPEVAMMNDETWMEVTKTFIAQPIDGDAAGRRAFMQVRRYAKLAFGMDIHSALRSFLSSQGGRLPDDVIQLKPYFDHPIDDAVLRRYEILQTGSIAYLSHDAILLGEKAPADPEYDTRLMFISTNQVRADDIYQTSSPWNPAEGRFVSRNAGK